MGCATRGVEGCGPSMPEVYTRVSEVLQWILGPGEPEPRNLKRPRLETVLGEFTAQTFSSPRIALGSERVPASVFRVPGSGVHGCVMRVQATVWCE
eukprot:276229-Rhodomonas_salina.1